MLLPALQKTRQQLRRSLWIAGQVGIRDQLIPQPDRLAMLLVVGPSGQLHESAAPEVRAVGRPLVPQVAEVIVQVEGMPAGRRVEFRLAFGYRHEALRFRADRAQRHQHHRLVGQLNRNHGVQDCGQMLFDVLDRRHREHLRDHRGGDCGNRRCRFWLGRRNLSEAQRGRRLRTHDSVSRDPRAPLERLDGALGPWPEGSVAPAGIEARLRKSLL